MSLVINLFGPSTAGKSTLAGILRESLDNLDVIDFDVIKRQIPNYDWTKHAQAGRDMTLNRLMLDIADRNTILLLMPSPKDKDEYDLIRSIAEAHNSTLLNIEVTAPNKVLVDRYVERLTNRDPIKKNWKFKTLDEFKEKLLESYYVPTDTVSFDSSMNSPEDIANNIFVLIR